VRPPRRHSSVPIDLVAREPRANPGKPAPASTRPNAVFSFIVDAPGETWIKPCRRVNQPSTTISPRNATDTLHSRVIESRRRWRPGALVMRSDHMLQMRGRLRSSLDARLARWRLTRAC
jgi:hypothetical protein